MKRTSILSPGHVVWAYAFRPFFLAAAAYGVLMIAAWIGILSLGLLPAGFGSQGAWHGHEMIFGFAAAALAGFSLTATPSWTDSDPVAGRRLVLLFGLWLSGRLTMLGAGLVPLPLVSAINLAFLPLLAFLLLRPMLLSRSTRHRSFIYAIIGLWASQVLLHAGWLLDDYDLAAAGLRVAMILLMLMIGLATTRISMVVVNLSLEERGEEARFIPRPPRRNLAGFTLLVFAAADAFFHGHPVTGWLALAAAAAQMDLLTDYHVGRALFRAHVLPIYVTHLWIAVGLTGLGVDALSGGGMAGEFRHALGIGAVGTSILAVMAIAGLRHGGRELIIGKSLSVAFITISAAALLRVAAPLVVPEHYMAAGVHAAGLLWMVAFAIYLAVFVPILLRPRADGRPG